jgi:hypothetical protein
MELFCGSTRVSRVESGVTPDSLSNNNQLWSSLGNNSVPIHREIEPAGGGCYTKKLSPTFIG